MSEDTLRWTVGDVSITSIIESQIDGIPSGFFFPDTTADLVATHAWLRPHFANENGHLHLRVQAFVIETTARTVVVDPCIRSQTGQPFSTSA